MANSSAQVEALQVTYTKAQEEFRDLESAALAVCPEIEGGVGVSGSSLSSRLRSLGGRIVERVKGALRLGVWKTLGVVSTYYLIDLEALTAGYNVTEGLDDDATVAAIDRADTAAALTDLFEDDLLPDGDEC